MAEPQLELNVLYAIQGYHKEHINYLQRVVFAEGEVRMLKEQLAHEQANTIAIVQRLSDENTSLKAQLEEIQNRSISEE